MDKPVAPAGDGAIGGPAPERMGSAVPAEQPGGPSQNGGEAHTAHSERAEPERPAEDTGRSPAP
jgi:hypothetical protein